MAIKDIARAEFIRLLSLHTDLEHWVGNEFSWFANAAESVIGTIALKEGNRGWNYVILKRNQRGAFDACNAMHSIFDQVTARIDCMRAMAAAENGGAEIAPPEH